MTATKPYRPRKFPKGLYAKVNLLWREHRMLRIEDRLFENGGCTVREAHLLRDFFDWMESVERATGKLPSSGSAYIQDTYAAFLAAEKVGWWLRRWGV